jgi:hypothetical protein
MNMLPEEDFTACALSSHFPGSLTIVISCGPPALTPAFSLRLLRGLLVRDLGIHLAGGCGERTSKDGQGMEAETFLPLKRLNHARDLIRAHAEDHHEIRQTLNELLAIFDDCSGPIALYREKIAAAIGWVDVFSDPDQCARHGWDPVAVRSFALEEIDNAIGYAKQILSAE